MLRPYCILTTATKGSLMKCPTCPETTLVMSDRQGIEIDYCPQCRGVWLDRGELDKIIERAVQMETPSSMNNAPHSNAPQMPLPTNLPPAGAPRTTPNIAVPGGIAGVLREVLRGGDDRDDYKRRRDYDDDDDYRRKKRKKGLLGELFD